MPFLIRNAPTKEEIPCLSYFEKEELNEVNDILLEIFKLTSGLIDPNTP